MGKRNVRVLITRVGSTTAVSVIKGLRKQGTFNTFPTQRGRAGSEKDTMTCEMPSRTDR